MSDGRKLRTCDHQIRKVVTGKLGKSSEVGTWLLKSLVDPHCPVTWSIRASTVTHCFSFETWSARSARAKDDTSNLKIPQLEFRIYPALPGILSRWYQETERGLSELPASDVLAHGTLSPLLQLVWPFPEVRYRYRQTLFLLSAAKVLGDTVRVVPNPSLIAFKGLTASRNTVQIYLLLFVGCHISEASKSLFAVSPVCRACQCPLEGSD